MPHKKMTLTWRGAFVELCLARVSPDQRRQIDALPTHGEAADLGSMWYENHPLLKRLFDVENWWSIDDVDHAMGLVFRDRAAIDDAIQRIAFTIDGVPSRVDPEALQLDFYAPEAVSGLDKGEAIVCHGASREAELHLAADVAPPFDPSLITLSFIDYPDHGLILIDLDYDGHDDVHFSWGETTYLAPRIIGKDRFDDAPGAIES